MPNHSAYTPSACHSSAGERGDVATHLTEQVIAILNAHRVTPPARATVDTFVRSLDICARDRNAWLQELASDGQGQMDILRFINAANRAGDADEALWRAFLAAHFGRPSADIPRQRDSAGRFLCGFSGAPRWIWEAVSADSLEFSTWLAGHAADLATLRFGNHRKFQSLKPEAIDVVVRSFVAWVRARGNGPADAFSMPVTLDRAQRFRTLYDTFTVYQSGRTGRFDLLCLLGEMRLLPIEPDSCYIPGSTGPLCGMQLLCGHRNQKVLGAIADDLARTLAVSCDLVQSTLCEWQKHYKTRQQ